VCGTAVISGEIRMLAYVAIMASLVTMSVVAFVAAATVG
jgi:hypothetical protein